MKAKPGFLITHIHGRLAGLQYRTLRDGSVLAQRIRAGPGPASQTYNWKYMQECVRRLDAYARGKPYAWKQIWGLCPPIHRGYRLSWQGHYYEINLRRMSFGYKGIAIPPDKFRSHKRYLPAGNPGHVIGVWTDGYDKDDNPFNEDGDIDPPPPPPPHPPPEPPPPPEVDCFECSTAAYNSDCWTAVSITHTGPDGYPCDCYTPTWDVPCLSICSPDPVILAVWEDTVFHPAPCGWGFDTLHFDCACDYNVWNITLNAKACGIFGPVAFTPTSCNAQGQLTASFSVPGEGFQCPNNTYHITMSPGSCPPH